ncbi:hypothetical protein ILUMI_26469 [Ignelater luminosus]|uniref:ABC transporter domain-containing protein n=1 Tax=Ignelater luminosus TaxID=2038154 RepID=A0A8K0FYM5_IGNLU|nr:hypothetical protein ILUMI_26469 [Ignelater luminosus]
MEIVLHEASTNTPCVTCGRSDDVIKVPVNGNVNGDVKEEDRIFSRLPQKDPIDITFENITYTASLGFRKGQKEILHNINGRFPPGQLIAIMGPSGAGKSTLLDVLSGYRISGIGGTVYTNGRPRDLNAFRKLSCYITQDDRLQPLLTVWENMKIAADLKLGENIPIYEKEDIIREILDTLGLAASINTRAGRLSGGQKKRLSIALELIDNPLVMFLDEPTTGLDSSSCSQCVKLLQELARQGRTIVCTIHQPSASLFQLFDLVYVLSSGDCLYQGTTEKMIPFLESVQLPCPMYHNPADYVIELACAEYGEDKIKTMVEATNNGKNLQWFDKPEFLPSLRKLRETHKSIAEKSKGGHLQSTSQANQLKILLRRGFLKSKRDSTLTYMRIAVNILVGLLFGVIYWQAGEHGGKVLDNYNLLFSILMHHMMSTMMLTILTFPSEMSILTKEHFNRWYSLKMYYLSITIVDLPLSIFCCVAFTAITYWMTGQPLEWQRIGMFTVISLLVVFVAQSFGLMIGAIFDVVNGTFVGPVLSVPMMMFAGFGVTLRDLPPHLYWGSYISYLRYGLEGIVGAIYGLDRPTIYCPDEDYCHYKYPEKFLKEISMKGDQFWNDVIALVLILFFLRIVAFVLLRWKLMAVR